MSLVKTRFSRLTVSAFLSLMVRVLNTLSANPVFLEVQAQLPDLSTKMVALRHFYHLALDGSKSAMLQRNQLFSEAIIELSNLAAHVGSLCGKDAAKVLRSGFDIVKQPQPVQTMYAPKRMIARSAKPSEVILYHSGSQHAQAYAISMSVDMQHWSEIAFTSKLRLTLSELESGSMCYLRVCAHGSPGPSDWSAIAHVRVA